MCFRNVWISTNILLEVQCPRTVFKGKVYIFQYFYFIYSIVLIDVHIYKVNQTNLRKYPFKRGCIFEILPKIWSGYVHLGRIICYGRILGRLVAADLPGKIHCSQECAHAQNYQTIAIYLISLLPPSVPKSPIGIHTQRVVSQIEMFLNHSLKAAPIFS